MKVCPYCGLENPDHAQCCAECDADLTEVRASRPARPTAQPPAQPYQQPQYPQQQQYPQQYHYQQPQQPRKRHTLRNVLLLVLALAVIGAVIGGTQAGKSSTATTLGIVTPQTESSRVHTFKWGETGVSDTLMVTVSAPADDTANLSEADRMWLDEGYKAIYCMVTIENISDEPYSYNTLCFTMYDSAGLSYESLIPVCTQPDLGSGELLPGRKVAGSISFSVLASNEPAYVDFAPTFSVVVGCWGY